MLMFLLLNYSWKQRKLRLEWINPSNGACRNLLLFHRSLFCSVSNREPELLHIITQCSLHVCQGILFQREITYPTVEVKKHVQSHICLGLSDGTERATLRCLHHCHPPSVSPHIQLTCWQQYRKSSLLYDFLRGAGHRKTLWNEDTEIAFFPSQSTCGNVNVGAIPWF